MPFIYRNANGTVRHISDGHVLAHVGPSCDCVEVTTLALDELMQRHAATGAPAFSCTTYDPTTETFIWSHDLVALELWVDGSLVDLSTPIDLTADGSSSLLFQIKKKSLRDGNYLPGSEIIDLQLSRGLLRNSDDTAGAREVQLVEGIAEFRVRSVAESVDAVLKAFDRAGQLVATGAIVRFV